MGELAGIAHTEMMKTVVLKETANQINQVVP